jgi:ergothioneine biosynthesis protein EgtB
MAAAQLLSSDREAALSRLVRVRQASIAMCDPLWPEEFRLQPLEEISPPWWNLGHTSWFFVRNVLVPFGGTLTAEDDQYDYLLNSYYHSLGQRLPRGQRGSVSRPTTEEIYAYRASVDERVSELIETIEGERLDELLAVVRIGVEHEQQHQELFFGEIKYILAQNPVELRRPYVAALQHSEREPLPLNFVEFAGGLCEFGCRDDAWCWDNELPVHQQFLQPFALANRLTTNAEYLEFIADGGYRDPLLWLDNGWQQVSDQGWKTPLYWQRVDGQWMSWTLHGMQPLVPGEPVCHVSFYEADAFACWKAANSRDLRNARLPSEREWEHAAQMAANAERAGSPAAFLDSGKLHPTWESENGPLTQMAGVLWQWTASYYEPYPGYRPFTGALAEYNGKFMDNQRVLRGGSCVTPREHYRPTYRNFWPAATRWQFTGIRLARAIGK